MVVSLLQPRNRMPRSRQNFAWGMPRVCVPGAIPWATQLSRIFSIAATMGGCRNSPPTPSDTDKSAGASILSAHTDNGARLCDDTRQDNLIIHRTAADV